MERLLPKMSVRGDHTEMTAIVEYAPETLDTIRQTVCKGATDAQFHMFIEVCKRTGLDPFLKEIWFVPNVGVMAGRDGYLRIANEHPQFDGMETRVERDENQIPIKATCSVWRKDRAHPITCEAFYNEYRKSSQVWQTYKSAMISKVAEVLALKRSFSINGVVTEEEIGNQEERGSREAQQEVAQRRIAELTPPTVSKETIIELADQLNGPAQTNIERPTIAGNFGPEPPENDPPPRAMPVKKPPRKAVPKNEMTEAAKAKWRQAKMQLRAVTGDDKAYYAALAPYKHCTEIPTKGEAQAIWSALQTALMPPSPREVKLDQKGDTALLLELSVYKQRFGDEEFARILGAHGFTSVDDFMVNANGIQTDTLLWDLKDRSRPQ
jgi:phage recombination protein Bet